MMEKLMSIKTVSNSKWLNDFCTKPKSLLVESSLLAEKFCYTNCTDICINCFFFKFWICLTMSANKVSTKESPLYE